MLQTPAENITTPRMDDLGLSRIANRAGVSISLLPNGAVFAIEHVRDNRRIMINQTLASPIADGMGGLYLRTGGADPVILPVIGPNARCRVGVGEDRFVWQGEQKGLRHRVSLWLHPDLNLWLWRVEAHNLRDREISCDAILIQDIGLGEPAFLMNNEAYASQYLDHFVATHPRMNFVLMNRQNLWQAGAHPWVAHGCLDGAEGYATDFRQLMGPAYRDADQIDFSFGTTLPSHRLQYETACAALQSGPAVLAPGAEAAWTFFGFYTPDHPAASSVADLALIDIAERARANWKPCKAALSLPLRTHLHDASPLIARNLDESAIGTLYPQRTHVEQAGGEFLSFFTPDKTHSRHIVLREKERLVARRHGALLFSGAEMLPSDDTLCATCWMHGVFGAQLTIGNTSFHKLFSVSRDPYNITRGNGLRMLVEIGNRWRLLATPSAFEMGLCDCRWIYQLEDRTIAVSAVVSGEEPAMQWRISVEGDPCRLLIFGHLVIGEHEFAHAGRMEIDATKNQFTFRPDVDGMWARQYPQAVFHLVTSAPEQVEAVGGDELLYLDNRRRSGAYAVMRTCPTREFVFAVVGSLTDAKRAESLAAKYRGLVGHEAMLAKSTHYWRNITRGLRLEGPAPDAEVEAINTIFPWFAHDAMAHLTVPHGLEQYSGAAWGTRDVCQGPMELLLSLEHDEPAKAILRIVFSQQHEKRGDWPQWFMLDPYSSIRDSEAHGDVIIWPLKALCDYVEATGDFAFLDERVAWRRGDTFEKTAYSDSVATHVETLISKVRERFIPGTHLIRYGNGDWNDSLQPVDPEKRDWMVSSWTVALLYQQLRRYAEILRRIGRNEAADELGSIAAGMREDFNRFLIRDETLAGYALFKPDSDMPALLLHPSADAIGPAYSMLPMVQAIAGGVFTQDQAQRHLDLIRNYLLFPDGARLMDRPIAYHGGPETTFRRAESAAFFGREIGLMYTHSHLRYAEAMSILGDPDALWEALLVANPIAVTDRLAHASLRQRNAYFSSSDAAFADRYQASAEWSRVRAGTISVDGGWRIYSSGPGLYTNMLVQHAFGVRRIFGARSVKPCLPTSKEGLTLTWADRHVVAS